jgi:hypothetical protein
MVRHRQEFDFFTHLDGLTKAALPKETSHKFAVAAQLSILIHYQLYHAMACMFRCHRSEALSATRVAIDAALIAYTIAEDPSLASAYIERKPPFDKLARHLKNKYSTGAVPFLLDRRNVYSQYASHADIDVFADRFRISDDESGKQFMVGYFQFDPERQGVYVVSMLFDFVVLLDLLSDFFISKVGSVQADWLPELQTSKRSTWHLSQISGQLELGCLPCF